MELSELEQFVLKEATSVARFQMPAEVLPKEAAKQVVDAYLTALDTLKAGDRQSPSTSAQAEQVEG